MGGDGFTSMLFFGLMFVIMWFFIIRPQVQKQKKEKSFQEAISVGTRVVTTAGIHGRISEIHDDIVILETSAGKLRIEKTAISRELTAARYSAEKAT
ncbi:MAG: preprotein translocase subunit YajC [Weeksellaceae bacterium]|nr:preprotein translocase subunit YajC [Weeksellaceae bacterium]